MKNRPLDIASHTDIGCQELLIVGENGFKSANSSLVSWAGG